jgi:hypothetical protein
VRPEGLGKLENIRRIGTRSRDLPVCSLVPEMGGTGNILEKVEKCRSTSIQSYSLEL